MCLSMPQLPQTSWDFPVRISFADTGQVSFPDQAEPLLTK